MKKTKAQLKREEQERQTQEFYEELGIVPGARQELPKPVYVIYIEDRSKLDRTKFPFERAKKFNDDLYVDRNKALAAIKKLEKIEENRNMFLSLRTSFIKESEWKILAKQQKYKEPELKKATISIPEPPKQEPKQLPIQMIEIRKQDIIPKKPKISPKELGKSPKELGKEKLRLKALIRYAKLRGDDTTALEEDLKKIEQ